MTILHRDSSIQISVPQLISCMILVKVLNLFGPQDFHLKDVCIKKKPFSVIVMTIKLFNISKNTWSNT